MSKQLKTIISRCVLVVLLAIAFGYIEAAVVVYLREIFHPNGFVFPLTQFPLTGRTNPLLLVEVGREAATLAFIFSASFLVGRNRKQRVAFFMIIFAVWDIFYYVFLKLILGWPASIMDWDVLFLIPVPWAGPVLSPILVSVMMLVFAGLILYRDYAGKFVKPTPWEWLCFSASAVLIIVSFCLAGQYMTQPDYLRHFSWPLYLTGLFFGGVLFAKYIYKKTPGPVPGVK
jgi:hypothetical protein